MDIQQFGRLLFERAKEKGFEDCEIYYNSGESSKISIYKGKIEKYKNRESGGFGFRGIYNGKMGYFFSENIDEDIIDTVLNNAIENSEIISSDSREFIFEGSDNYSDVKTWSRSISDITTEEKIQMALDMEAAAYSYDSRIKAVNSSVVTTGEASIYIANTKGMELREKSNSFVAYIEVMAASGDEVKEKVELYYGLPENFNPTELSEKVCKNTIASLGGKSVKSSTVKAVVKNEAFADFLECFTGNFYAENVQKGFSLLKNKLGAKIASEIITIKDNSLMDYNVMTTAFDSEGVACYDKNVVENGILKTYLYNLKSAEKDNVSSTGNGFKSSFKGAVNTLHTNFYIEGGSISFDDMIKDIASGIYITSIIGFHSGANSISGDFSLAAEGFKIENGKITSPIEQITIAGNFYDVLLSIGQIADDLKFNLSGVGSPSVVIDKIDVAGSFAENK